MKTNANANFSKNFSNNSYWCFLYFQNSSVVHLLPVLAESELPKLVNSEQRLLLTIQFQQHVQLMAQHFVMTYMHPEYHSLAKVCKQNLNSLRYGDIIYNMYQIYTDQIINSNKKCH